MKSQMSAGDLAKETIGASGSTVGKPNSYLMGIVKNVIFAGVVLTAAQQMMDNKMRPGASVLDTLGNSGEAFTKTPNGGLARMIMAGALLEGTFKLMDAVTGKPTQDQVKEMQAHDAEIKSEIAKQDAIKAEAGVEEDRRRAFFNKPPSM